VETAIVTDSTADLPQNLLERYSIFQIPVDLTLENKTYLDGFDLSRSDFYNRLPHLESLPTTAAPSAGRFQEMYSSIFEKGYQKIISIHPSKKLSGIFNAARLAAEEFSHPIEVIDSEQLSMGLGFQVLKAAELAREGFPIEEIIREVRDILNRVRVFAMLDTFRFIQRSGRVSWAKARIGSILQIKPVLELKGGEVINMGASRTRSKGIAYLGKTLHDLGELDDLAVLHTNSLNDGRKFINQFAPKHISNPILVNVTTIIGTHVGPNALGFAAVVK
jgi:DegV family protein with EDD domain